VDVQIQREDARLLPASQDGFRGCVRTGQDDPAVAAAGAGGLARRTVLLRDVAQRAQLVGLDEDA
jgi:hypothetical protein